MANSETTKRFIFTNRAEDLFSFTTHIIDYVVQQTGKNSLIKFKLNVALTELVTNSLKHSGGGNTIIEVVFFTQGIRVNKIDDGKPLTITTTTGTITWPLVITDYKNPVFTIYGDDLCTLKAKLINNDTISFFIEEKQLDAYDDNFKMNLLEHLGLLIIARAADEFLYSFNAMDGSNVFSIVIFTE